ncbi:IMP dehydrogenase [Candidatus Woesearchaeota archaeon]|nr:IMP dehydrogenase [Candidatus Woesearchaeota archaeon]
MPITNTSDIPLALSYDDVLIVPNRSPVKSRKDVDISGRLTKDIILKVPIIPANMASVCEKEMAIAMARLGSIGLIHRFMTIEEEVEHVQAVKRIEQFVIEEPYSLPDTAKLKHIEEFKQKHGLLEEVGSFLIVDSSRKLRGIVTHRDLQLEQDPEKPLTKIMTSKLVTASPEINMEEAMKLMTSHKIEKLPLLNDDGTVAGLITMRDILQSTQFPDASKDKQGKLLVGASIGVMGDYLERAEALVKAGVDILVIDIAHGHSDLAINTLRAVKQKWPAIPVMVGNVATAEAVKDLAMAGADCIKVGVGPGSACTTRIVVGAGVPQFTAVLECVAEAKSHGIPINADGGIENSGNAAKAFAAGADTILCGNLFAGCEESPGKLITKHGKRFKLYRGSASISNNMIRKARAEGRKLEEGVDGYTAEGVESVIPFRGSAQDVVNSLVGGIRSGMSYAGARNLKELHEKARFVRITDKGLKESHPHDLTVI